MGVLEERVDSDIKKLEALSISESGRVKIKGRSGSPVNSISLELHYPTAPCSSYPRRIQDITLIDIFLLHKYPVVEPSVKIKTPIFHPNVWDNGEVCLGYKWIPSEGLDLLVRRIIKIITFDTQILNEDSPANQEALDWYRSAIRLHPNAFPTDRLGSSEIKKKKILWKDI